MEAKLNNAVLLQAEGYESLALVLQRAFQQAAHGKGKERHAKDAPFEQQPMQQLIGLYGVGFALGQAAKKAQESQRLQHDAAVRELLGAINYLAGAVVAMEAQRKPVAANDNGANCLVCKHFTRFGMSDLCTACCAHPGSERPHFEARAKQNG